MNEIYVVSHLTDYMYQLGFAADKKEAEKAIDELVKQRGFSRGSLYIAKYKIKKEYQEFEDED